MVARLLDSKWFWRLLVLAFVGLGASAIINKVVAAVVAVAFCALCALLCGDSAGACAELQRSRKRADAMLAEQSEYREALAKVAESRAAWNNQQTNSC